MGRYVSKAGEQATAVQYLDKMSTIDRVNLHDWVHDVDSSTIYGAVCGFIESTITKHGGLAVPGKKGETYYPTKHLVTDTDWIIKHGPMDFTVLSDAVFQKLFTKIEVK